MDWSLLQPKARYPLLRPELLYSHISVRTMRYHFALALLAERPSIDLLFRTRKSLIEVYMLPILTTNLDF
jgi:hypothetical protein